MWCRVVLTIARAPWQWRSKPGKSKRCAEVGEMEAEGEGKQSQSACGIPWDQVLLSWRAGVFAVGARVGVESGKSGRRETLESLRGELESR
jgi:hypothetical protein